MSSIAHAGNLGGGETLECVMRRIIERQAAGETPCDSEVLAQHPELRPALDERLRMWRSIRSARLEAARRRDESAEPLDSGARTAGDELAELGKALPGYELVRPVHYGGQGIVYFARQISVKRGVAIKLLLDGILATERQRARFEMEAELTARLQHPNIVALYEYGSVRARPYLALEFVEGLPIDDYALLNDLSPRAILTLFVTACRAVEFAHQNGIIHRDLKPANILVDDSGAPHVLDFGLAKDAWSTIDGPTSQGQVVGTLPYVSPEQARGDAGVDVRSDTYSLAVVLYQLLTEGFPYAVEGEWHAVRNGIISTEPLPLREGLKRYAPDRWSRSGALGRDVEIILQKALAKDQRDRYQSAAALADDLERYLAGDAVLARAGHRLYAARKLLRRHRVGVAVAGVILLIMGAATTAVTHAWWLAVAQRDSARQATGVAYGLFERFLSMDEGVQPLAGGVALREKLLSDVARALPELADLATDDALRVDLVERQGDIARQQGQREGAAKYYAELLEARRRALDHSPDSIQAQTRLLQAFAKAASLSESADALYQQAFELGEHFCARSPRNADLGEALAQLYDARGEAQYDDGSFSAAAENLQRAINLLTASQDVDGRPLRRARLLAAAHGRLGQAQLRLGDSETGAASLLCALEIRRELVAAHPAHTPLRHELMLTYLHLAKYERDRNHAAAAADLLTEAAAAGELLCRLDPTVVDWKQDWYTALHRLAAIRLDTGRVAEARALSDTAARIATELVAQHGHSVESRAVLAFALELQGEVELRGEAPAAASSAFQQAAWLREQVAAEDPSVVQASLLAGTYNSLGRAARRLEDVDSAIACCETAVALREQAIARAESPDIELAIALVSAKINLAAMRMVRSEPTDRSAAEAALEDADRRLEALRCAGQLSASDRRYCLRREALDRNCQLLAERSVALEAAAALSGATRQTRSEP